MNQARIKNFMLDTCFICIHIPNAIEFLTTRRRTVLEDDVLPNQEGNNLRSSKHKLER
jgi:hypothetical protein